MREIWFGKDPDKIFKEHETRIDKVLEKTNKEHANVDFARLTNCQRWYEESFKGFNTILSQISNKKKSFNQALSEFKYFKDEYEKIRQRLIDAGADVSGLKKKLNYMEIQN